MTTSAVRVPPPSPSPSPCAFTFPSSLCLFSKKMAGSNVDGDKAVEGKGLNRRTPSSLRNGSRATRCFETRAATNRPLRCNRRDALTLRVRTLQFQLNPRRLSIFDCREDGGPFRCLKRIATARFDLKVRKPVRQGLRAALTQSDREEKPRRAPSGPCPTCPAVLGSSQSFLSDPASSIPRNPLQGGGQLGPRAG